MKKIVFLLILLAILSCNKLHKGLVIKKIDYPGYWYPVYTYNTNGTISSMVMTFQPETYYLRIKGNYKGKMIVEDHQVYAQQYFETKLNTTVEF